MTAVTDTVRSERPGPSAAAIKPIPLTRLVSVELSKMFDTRSGFWLMISIGIVASLATAGVIAFAPDEELSYALFATVIGVPIGVVLPIMAVLAVTSEWSQRSGLTTFTLVPHRHRVVLAKAIAAVLVGVVSVVAAMAIGALGNVIGSAINGVDPQWDVTVVEFLKIVLGNVLGLLTGFMLGVLIRNSPGAIVGYFVLSFVVPAMTTALAAFQEWFRDVQPWVDFNFASAKLFGSDMNGEAWAQLGVTGVIWLVIPLTIGVFFVLRSEVK